MDADEVNEDVRRVCLRASGGEVRLERRRGELQKAIICGLAKLMKERNKIRQRGEGGGEGGGSEGAKS